MRPTVEHIRVSKNGTVTSQTRDADELNKELIWRQFPPNTTELMICAAYGDIFTARKIYKNEVGRLNDHKMSALMYACLNGRLEMVKMLIDLEDIRQRNIEGLSGVDMAFYNRKFDCCLFLEDYCINHGYNDLKPKPRTNAQQQKEAMKQFKELHDYNAEDMLDEIDDAKARFVQQQEADACNRNPPARKGGPVASRPKFCTNCGTKVQQDSAKFCTNCGERLAK